MIQLGYTGIYVQIQCHCLCPECICQLMAVSEQKQEKQTIRKTNVESPGHKIMYVKIKPRSFGIIHHLPSKPGPPVRPHSLIGRLDLTAGFLHPMNGSAVHHGVRKSSSATAITKIGKTGQSFNATWRSPWADFVSRSFGCAQRSAWTCLKSSRFGGSQGSACAGPVSCGFGGSRRPATLTRSIEIFLFLQFIFYL